MNCGRLNIVSSSSSDQDASTTTLAMARRMQHLIRLASNLSSREWTTTTTTTLTTNHDDDDDEQRQHLLLSHQICCSDEDDRMTTIATMTEHVTALLLVRILPLLVVPHHQRHHHHHHHDGSNRRCRGDDTLFSAMYFGFTNLSTTTICQECLQALSSSFVSLNNDDHDRNCLQQQESESQLPSSSPLLRSFFGTLLNHHHPPPPQEQQQPHPTMMSNTIVTNHDDETSKNVQMVIQQLQDYVDTILSLYNNHKKRSSPQPRPFHNAQRAHHVVCAANKLMDIMLVVSSTGKSSTRSVHKNQDNPDATTSSDDDDATATAATTASLFGLQHDPLALLALLLAALIQNVDYDDGGQQQQQHDSLDSLYQGESVVERHALHVAFTELLRPETTTTTTTKATSSLLPLPPLTPTMEEQQQQQIQHCSGGDYRDHYKYGHLLAVLFPSTTTNTTTAIAQPQQPFGTAAAATTTTGTTSHVHLSSSLSSSLSWQAFHRLVVSLVLSTDLSSPQQTQLSLTKWEQADLFQKSKPKRKSNSNSSHSNNGSSSEFLSLLEQLVQANTKQQEHQDKKDSSTRSRRSQTPGRGDISDQRSSKKKKKVKSKTTATKTRTSRGGKSSSRHPKKDGMAKSRARATTTGTVTTPAVAAAAAASTLKTSEPKPSSKKPKPKSSSSSSSSSGNSSSSRGKRSEKEKNKKKGDNNDNAEQSNQETVTMQQSNANHDNNDKGETSAVDNDNTVMSVSSSGSSSLSYKSSKSCSSSSSSYKSSKSDEHDEAVSMMPPPCRAGAITTTTTVSSTSLPLRVTATETNLHDEVVSGVMNERAVGDNDHDDDRDVGMNRSHGDTDVLDKDDDSSSSSSSMSSCSSDMSYGSIAQASWKDIDGDDDDDDDDYGDDADDESYLEQGFHEKEGADKEESPLIFARDWSSDSGIISSMRTCPRLLDEYRNDHDPRPEVFRVHGMTLSSPWPLPKSTKTTPARAILTETTTAGSLSPLTTITAAMTESPSSPPRTPALSAPWVDEKSTTISSKNSASGSGARVRSGRPKTPIRSKSLTVKKTAALSPSTALPSSKKASTSLTSTPTGRKYRNTSDDSMSPPEPILSKYTKKRLGIQRTMDLSGQLIETYPATTIFSTGISARKKGRQQGPDAFKASVVLETILAAANVAEYLQGWEPMVYWSQRLFQELHHDSRQTSNSCTMTASKWFVNRIGFMEMRVLPVASKLESMGVYSSLKKAFFTKIVHDCLDQWLLDGETVTAQMFASNQQPENHDSSVEQQRLGPGSPGGRTAPSNISHRSNIGFTTTSDSPPVKPRGLALLPSVDLKEKLSDMERILTEINKSPRINKRLTCEVDEAGNGEEMLLAKTKAELVEARNTAFKYHQQLFEERRRAATAQESYDEELTRILFSHEEVCGKLREGLERCQHELHVLQAQQHTSASLVSCHPRSREQRTNSHDSDKDKAVRQLEHRVQELQGQLGRLGSHLETAECRVKRLEEELSCARKSQQDTHRKEVFDSSKSLENDETNNSSSMKKPTSFKQSKGNDSSKELINVTGRALMQRRTIVSFLFFMTVFVFFSISIVKWMEAAALDHMAFARYGSSDPTTISIAEWVKDKFDPVIEKIPGWVQDKVAAVLQQMGRG